MCIKSPVVPAVLFVMNLAVPFASADAAPQAPTSGLTPVAVTQPADAMDDAELDLALRSNPQYRNLQLSLDKLDMEIANSRIGPAHPRMANVLRRRELLRQRLVELREQVRKQADDRAKFMGQGLGLIVDRVPSEAAARLNLPRGAGLVIQRVLPNTPGRAGGLMPGDVLLRLDGQLLVNNEQFEVLIESLPAGREVQVELFRDGEGLKRTLKVARGTNPEP